MKKLNETNSNFEVKMSKFHGGQILCYTNSLKVALQVLKKNTFHDCYCGCVLINALNENSLIELEKYKSERGIY